MKLKKEKSETAKEHKAAVKFWKKELGRQDDNFANIETNLRYGCAILKFYLDKENGHLSRALARYNGSAGKTWYPEKVMTKWQDYWIAGQA